jgi:hypothetical protein
VARRSAMLCLLSFTTPISHGLFLPMIGSPLVHVTDSLEIYSQWTLNE